VGYCGWVILGFFAGLIGRALMPGHQPMGLVMTTLLGIAGSFVGGSIAAIIYGGNPMKLQPSGFVGAILGSVVLLIVARMLSDHRGKRRR
jgi:uncharacterized membrane protein YeaQ/YmgE (transglycosylase-associated protein family)